MSLITEYFAAASDVEAVALADAGSPAVNGGLTGYSIEPSVNMPSLEELLTTRTYAELLAADAYPTLGDSDGLPFVLRLHDGLVDALLAADDNRLRAVAQTWAQLDEMAGADPRPLFQFITELRALGEAAERRSENLYCWVT